MEQLGLSSSTPKMESRLKALFWPDVADEVAARTTARNGRFAAFFVSAVTAIFSLVGFIPVAGLFDSVLFLVIGVFIGRMSRVAAVAGFILYAIEQSVAFASGRGSWNILVLAIMLSIFFNSIRATWAFHKLPR